MEPPIQKSNFLQKIRPFFTPSRLLKTLPLLLIAIALPLTVVILQRSQDTRQHASENGTIAFLDVSTNAPITQTTNPNVKLQITLPENILLATPSAGAQLLITKAYAQTESPTPIQSGPTATPDAVATTTPTPFTSPTVTPPITCPTAPACEGQLLHGDPSPSGPQCPIYFCRPNLTNTPIPTIILTPAPKILQSIIISNTDAGTGGQSLTTISGVDLASTLSSPYSWTLNPLGPTENSATRTVSIQFSLSDSSTLTTTKDITLTKINVETPPTSSTSSAIQITTIDPNASFYGTYQSHNQKVVANTNGIFMTYIKDTVNRDTNNENSTWVLARSTDNGQTFTTVYSVNNAHSRAPVIETDSQGNIYAVEANWADTSQAHFYKFSSNNYTSPEIQTNVNLGTISAKYAMEIDETRNQLYFLTNPGTFTILGLDGSIKTQFQLTSVVTHTNGNTFRLHYPLFYMDTDGYLYVAWTTTNDTLDKYWSINFMRSRDGAATWEKPTGLQSGQQLSLPIDPSDTGTSIMITPPDELAVNTWLESFLVKAGKVHFMYKARTPLNRMHYVRYDLATGQIDKNLSPLTSPFKGNQISFDASANDDNLDGFFATLQNPSDTTIYAVNRNVNTAGPYAVAVLESKDNGTTWDDFAIGPAIQGSIYSLGGSPNITNDGFIIGSFTESSNFQDDNVAKIVKFFKVKTSSSAPVPTTLVPSLTETPPASGSANLTFSVVLNGIGIVGATGTSQATNNPNPHQRAKDATIYLYAPDADPSADPNGDQAVLKISQPNALVYNSTTGRYDAANFNLGTSFAPGTYQVMVKTPLYLRKKIGNLTLIAGANITTNIAALAVGDSNNDNKIDTQDYAIYLTCFNHTATSDNIAKCDYNNDGKIDTSGNNIQAPSFLDFRLFQNNFTIQQGE